MPSSRPDVSFLTSGHDVADARLHREVDAATRHGLSVEVLGLGDPRAAPAAQRVRTRPRPSGMLARLALALRLPWRAGGTVLFVLDPDLVPAGLLAARVRRRRLVVDVHEDYRALLADRAWARGPAGRLVGAGVGAVLRLARLADLLVVADAHVPPLTAPNRLVVRNVGYARHLPQPGEADPAPRAVYIGDVRESRGLKAMLAALADAPQWSLDVVGPVSSDDEAWLRRWQGESAAAARVRFHGRLPPDQAWAFASGAWAGLCLLDDTPAFRDALPTKIYEYLACGLPVVTSSLPRAASLVTAAGAGVVVSGADELSATLRCWAVDPSAPAAMRGAAARWARQAYDEPSPYDELADHLRRLSRADSVEAV